MNDTANNPYRAPESDVNTLDSGDDINNFSRFSAWGVLGLSIITLGIYPIYWMYTRSRTLNAFHENRISPAVLSLFMLFVVASFAIGFIGPQGDVAAILSLIINLGYTVLYLMVLFGLRNRLKGMVDDNINPIITFFGSAIYLQYVINKGIDQSTQPA